MTFLNLILLNFQTLQVQRRISLFSRPVNVRRDPLRLPQELQQRHRRIQRGRRPSF